MNFHIIPELAWPFGYAYAIGMMVVITVVMLVGFKRSGWW
jgi:magnesium transporter